MRAHDRRSSVQSENSRTSRSMETENRRNRDKSHRASSDSWVSASAATHTFCFCLFLHANWINCLKLKWPKWRTVSWHTISAIFEFIKMPIKMNLHVNLIWFEAFATTAYESCWKWKTCALCPLPLNYVDCAVVRELLLSSMFISHSTNLVQQTMIDCGTSKMINRFTWSIIMHRKAGPYHIECIALHCSRRMFHASAIHFQFHYICSIH